MGMELEWKYASDRETLSRIERENSADWRTIEMESLYYDTPGRDLSSRRWTLRLRRENGEAVVCLKTPAGGRARGEWEVRRETVAEAADALLAMGAPDELRTMLENGLETVCAARYTRRAASLDADGALIELALDSGVLRGGEKTLPLCEAEVELKEGDPAQAERFAAELAKRYGLREEAKSKFQRAFALQADT